MAEENGERSRPSRRTFLSAAATGGAGATGPALACLVAAFHRRDRDRQAPAGTSRRLSDEMDALMAGRAPAPNAATLPPSDNSLLLGFKDGTGTPDAGNVALMDRAVWFGAGDGERRKDSGAPLDGSKETDLPRYADNPRGERIPLNAHIRPASPRTAGPEKATLPRGLFYALPGARDGYLGQGLVDDQ